MLYTCTPHCIDPTHRHTPQRHAALAVPYVSRTTVAPGRAVVKSSSKKGGREPVIDIHCHYLNAEVAAKASELNPAQFDPSTIFANELTRAVNAKQMQDRAPKLTGIDERINDMDRMGVDIQVISPAPFQYFYFADAERGAALAREVNEGIASLVSQTPDRFVGLGSIPLQNAELAVRELEYAMGTLGLRGVEINTNVNGMNLTDPKLGLDRFFSRANELKAVVFLHPVGFTEAGRLTNHYFNNVIGNPMDTTIAVSHLIFDGIVARHPKIKFIAAHGGGYIAHYWARMDHAWTARPDCRTVLKRAPSTYLKKFYFDTVVFDPVMLRHLVDVFGADHVLLGSDYPYDMGEEDPRGLVRAVKGLSSADRSLIEGGNAAKLFTVKRPR